MKTDRLAATLAVTAIDSAGERGPAATALIVAAARILQEDFGPTLAADLMLGMVQNAHAAVVEPSLVATPTVH